MSHNERDPIPKSGLKLASSTSSSVPWTLDHIRNRTPFSATNLMPSAHDTTHTQFVKEPSPSPNPAACQYHYFPVTLLCERRLPDRLSSLRDLNTCVSTFGTPIIQLCRLHGHGRPQKRLVSNEWPLTMSSLNNYGIAASTTSLAIFFS